MPPRIQRAVALSGHLSIVPIRAAGFYDGGLPADLPLRRRLFGLYLEAMLRLRLFFVGAWRGLVHASGVFGVGRLYLSVVRANGGVEHLGLVCTKVVTTAGVNYIRDDFNNAAGSADVSLFNFHGIGTGAAAEAIGDTALGAESTTALNPASTRATGTRSTPSSKTYQTVGTLTAASAIACTEHGIFTQSATGGGTLLDRSVFSVVNLATGDSLQATYQLVLSDGG